ncbi:hypothetical protein GALL_520030 [mine drainage metagenome]|uniref:Alpha fucosidase A-like C-terminal domain-containing protein n=1 Tax=mine drainage metagenome TaxID=410659 RepID=A0A1J5P5G1_9ZZZZ
MLLQSQGDAIELLPALPVDLPHGNIKGICARGGFVLNFNWKNDTLDRVEVTSKAGGVCRLQYHNKIIEINTVKGGTYYFDGMLKKV